jgi:hypothetical protein
LELEPPGVQRPSAHAPPVRHVKEAN